MGDKLKIEYSSNYELLQLAMKQPAEHAQADRNYADAQKELDTATMELYICVAELVDGVCRDRFGNSKAPATAKQEIRRAEIQLNPKWQVATEKVINAQHNATILKGVCNGFFDRKVFLELIAKTELRLTGYNQSFKSGKTDYRTVDDKANGLSDKVDIPD